MRSNQIAPKDEVKNASNPERVVFKDTISLGKTYDNPAKPTSSTIKENQKECVDVSKNLEGPAEVTKNPVKSRDVEDGDIPKNKSKEVKSEKFEKLVDFLHEVL